MKSTRHETLIADYLQWLQGQYIGDTLNNDIVEITTPFLDQHNDNIQIYIRQQNDSLILSDDHYTLNNLKMSGCEIDTPKRKEILQSIFLSFGIKQNDDELLIESTTQSFPRKMHAFIQAIMAVNDLFVLAKPTIESIFKEDVEKFLMESNIRYLPSVKFPGKSGFDYLFHFAIPASSTHPERIIQAINNPSKDNTIRFIGQWQDINLIRPKPSKFIPILNDRDHKVNEEVIAAYSEYSARPILWSQRDKYVEELIA